MEKLQNCEILEKLSETKTTRIYRGLIKGTENTVIIKSLKTGSPSASEVVIFRQEYELLKNIDLEGVVKIFDITDQNEHYAIILEDFDGVSLKKILHTKNRFSIQDFLDTALVITEILGELHRMNIIHRDIKPHNILINSESKTVKITNFGIDTLLTHENDDIYNPEIIENKLTYMSPEQTGRMNRTLDYRTDLYSLGITFYEMLTGTVPFKSSDPMAIIHSHLAIQPLPPNQVYPDIPVIISDIIMKLLSKNTENRYQNAFGLTADLKKCRTQLKTDGEIRVFKLAQHDISNRFILPQMLYGREGEIARLLSCFGDASSGKSQILLVSGAPGIGKSALVNEIRNPIVAVRGYFISGKYEQFRRDIPYSAIIQSFKGMVNQILSESQERIRMWKEKLMDALGDSGKIITDFFPDLEMIIGRQGQLETVDPAELRNRFNYTFEKFVAALATKEHPVAIFLDDLQWADLASLTLITNIVSSENIRHLMIIGSYRDNEVDETHPLSETLREIEKKDIEINRISLGPLTEYDLKNFIMDFLKCTEEKGSLLANLVHRKTDGNPFFTNQFLHTLYNEKLLELDPVHGWQWDMENINRMQVTDNVVELLSGKINKLPEETRNVLKTGACVGNRFDLETLSNITGRSIEEILPELIDIVNDGFAYIVGDVYIFLHDRIHEAAYSLVTDEDKAALHHRIGTLALAEARKTGDLEKNLFYIIDQLNIASTLITDEKEREELAGMNLDAGVKAMVSVAYAPAFRYLQTGLDLLGEQPWQQQYELTLALHTASVEVCYLLGDFDTMDVLANITIEKAHSVLDRVKIYESRINALKARRDYEGAMNMAFPVLRELGIRLPKNPSQLRVGPDLFKTMIRLFFKKPETIFDLPLVIDEKQRAVSRLLTSMAHAAFFISPNIFALSVLKTINRAFKYGSTPDIYFAVTAYGIVLLAAFGDINAAYRIGNLGIKMANISNTQKTKSRIYFLHNMLLRHWKEPLIESLEPALEGYRIGKETGDLEYAAWNLQIFATVAPLCGMELSEFEREMAKYNKIIYDMNQDSVGTLHSVVWQFILCIMGRTIDPLRMKGDVLDEDEIEAQWIREKNRPALAVFYFLRIVLRFIFNEYALALEDSPNYLKYHDALAGSPLDPYFYLVDSVARVWLSPDVSWFKRRKYLILARINKMRIKRWAKYSPQNKLQFYYAIEAVWAAKVKTKIPHAIQKVDLAIKTAQEHNDLVVESIANDVALRYAFSVSDDLLARNNMTVSYRDKLVHKYMTAAYACYSRWGAGGKLKQYGEQYPDLLPSVRSTQANAPEGKSTPAAKSSSEALDLSTILKASHTLSGEIVLESLLVRMIGIVIENAGADRGIMILNDNGRLLIEAEGSVGSDNITVLKSIPIESHHSLSSSIVNYAARTKETLLLNDVTNEGSFIVDPYIINNAPKSVLCFPLLNQGKLSGLLYLENTHTTGAFTPERIEVLDMLSAQIAISIDNAKLYEHLEEKVRERTEDLQISNNQLQEAQRIAQIDMRMATNVQTTLLPKKAPENPGWDIAFEFRPMSGVSGDFYDFYEMEGTLRGIALFDVSGHGIASGLITMIARSVFSRNFYKKNNESLSEILNKSNRDLINEIGNVDNYLTGIMLRFEGNRVEYVNAAHTDLICKRSSSKNTEIINLEDDDFRGLFLGLKDVELSYEEMSFDVTKGDTLLIYSDCLNESNNIEGEQYGTDRLISSYENAPDTSAQEILDYILQDFDTYRQEQDVNDDLTVIVARRKI